MDSKDKKEAAKSKDKLKISFDKINKNNIKQLELLNNLYLPVRYMPAFYMRIVQGMRFGRYAYINDIIVGAITWKYDYHKTTGTKAVYIMTITVLKNFQRNGIGSQLIKELIRLHRNMKEMESICLHVQVGNDLALRFYQKNGFKIVETLDNYYTDIEPKSAHFLKYFLHGETKEEQK
ncbi:MAG: GNAT family N-acetyltransferase [archaeon]|nr:GNAT family N-acetyltransferase [archaeon]